MLHAHLNNNKKKKYNSSLKVRNKIIIFYLNCFQDCMLGVYYIY